ncbi:hypothetical protein KZC51_01405 [Microbacterium sp. SSW1-49]|uniref:Uncharacterized protein n=1 Tax=Microbacterium croceum TaxID=2851645 RepID=A0ABT0F9Q1_9MICO|nr:hypothetical protein [Microbacterium croceum]MCK2034778.1 hypothetical protein [Microbacterium croceum]
MTITPAPAIHAPSLRSVFTDIASDPAVKEGLRQALRIGGKTLADAWVTHHGNEAVIALVRSALVSRG